MRILGVDYGSKRIGWAVSDETGTVAPSVGYVTGGVADVVRLAAEKRAVRIVVGVPVRLNNTASPQTQRTLAFLAELGAVTAVPVVRWDERVLLEGNVRRKERREKIDQLAAQLMLQSYLDAIGTQEF